MLFNLHNLCAYFFIIFHMYTNTYVLLRLRLTQKALQLPF